MTVQRIYTHMKTTPKLPPDMPALPDGFKFINRGLPCYTNDELGMAIYIDHVDPTQREHEKRFVVQYIPADDLMTDDLGGCSYANQEGRSRAA
jgi:hypothetical protein